MLWVVGYEYIESASLTERLKKNQSDGSEAKGSSPYDTPQWGYAM